MSDIYLRSVEFSNFRVYGDSYAYEFPAGPGVTLITGGNGLGKTSFFDGVEWALSGQVGRFSDIHVDGRRKTQDPLTRIGAPENSHRVSLQFSEGAPIDRGAGFETNEAGIARLLKQPGWAEIADLHGYLSITHFFGQTSAQRFSLKKPNEQWEALKGPAGVDRINALRERMSGPGVRRAFTRAVEERTKRLEAATAAMASWHSLLETRDRTKQLASSENAIPPADIRLSINRLAEQILIVSPAFEWTPANEYEQPEAILDRFATLVRAVNDQFVEDRRKIGSLSQLVSAFDAANSDATAVASQLELTKQSHAAAVSDLQIADEKLYEVTSSLASCETKRGQAISRLVSIDRVFTTSRNLADAQARQTSVETDLNSTSTSSAELEASVGQLQAKLAAAIAQRAERRALADRLGQARNLTQIFKEITTLSTEIVRISELLKAKMADDPRAKRARLVTDAAVVGEEISAYMTELRRHDDRMQAITDAVTAIAHRLEHDDTCCPICTTVLPPGRLLELARAQSASNVTPAAQLATALAEARLNAERLQYQLTHADAELAEIHQLEAILASVRSRESKLRQQLVDQGGVADATYDDTGVVRLEQELDMLDEKLSEGAAAEDLKSQMEAAEAELKAEAAKRASLQQALSDVSEASHMAKSILLEFPDLWSPEQGVLIDLESERAAAEMHSKETSEQVAMTQASVLNARSTRGSLQEVVAREAEALDTLTGKQKMIWGTRLEHLRLWGEAGYLNEPSGSFLTEHQTRLVEHSIRAKSVEDSLQLLVTGYRKWIGYEQLRLLEDEIAKKLTAEDGKSEGEVIALLARRMEKARDNIKIAQNARQRVETVGSSMQQRAGTYADEVLVPLNNTIKRFARALMTWSDESISYHAEHTATRSELRPGIVKRAVDGSITQMEMNPNLYFSEGQLSALSVAALLAASTTFGWSRWRGLLLDDPLQHNDVIHASAFMDMLRQLVNGLGYQIILSTHDSAEAEFLSRKCGSAGIPYQIHELAPRGEGGLVHMSDRLSNLSASRTY
ncbi:AAA family ATPase [Massilia psychrophila]|uniref:Chromosome segregation protein SMC n=1 Tax=Massilia psychrophila TaxID=1603353 RepID=A0A2G8T1I9_9BURK|nr:AAA family ATPase [Massilia psychrophila]PIL39927.1 chromosome segregation protein SMC [Massilia psychrophila]GGE80914.1 chromosome segregation protein SMC [Massilia psychrophila]